MYPSPCGIILCTGQLFSAIRFFTKTTLVMFMVRNGLTSLHVIDVFDPQV